MFAKSYFKLLISFFLLDNKNRIKKIGEKILKKKNLT